MWLFNEIHNTWALGSIYYNKINSLWRSWKYFRAWNKEIGVIIVDRKAKESELTTRLVSVYNGIIAFFLAVYNQYVVEYYIQGQAFIYSKLKKWFLELTKKGEL